MAVTAPALIAIVAWGTGAWRARRRRTAITVAAHGLAALLFLVARTAVLGAFGHGATTAGGAAAQLAMVPWRLGAYLSLTLSPLGHSAAYVLPSPGAAWLAAAWAVSLAVGVLVWRATPIVGVGAGWFAVTLAPVLGLVPVFADLADRFALLPSVGLAWLAPVAIAALGRRWRPLAVVAPGLLLVMYGAGTIVEGAAWRDEGTLWAKAVALQPRSAQAQRNLGLILLQRGQPAEALGHFEEARALGEEAGELDRRRAMALEALGRFEEAGAAAAEAVRRDPTLGPAHALRGGLLVRRGRMGEAEEALALARRYDPDGVSTLLLDAEIAAARNDRPRAAAATAGLVARFPKEPRFHHRRAVALLQAGDARGAAESAAACLRWAPGQPQCLCVAGKAAVAAGGRATEEQERACAKAR